MINFIKDIINDTLKNKDGKFSSKKIMSCIAYNLAIAICLINIIISWVDMIKKDCYTPDMATIVLLFSIAGYSSTLTVYSNKKT